MAMPAPIPIVRVPPGESSSGSSSSFVSGSSRMGNSFGTSFPSSNSIGGSASFREAMAMATSFGKDVNDLLDYSAGRFASSVDSEMTIAPSTSLGRLESTFCRDFSCCGQDLGDLHDLLQHYEECHVRFDDDGMPGMIDDDGNSSSGGSTSTPSSMPPSPRTAHARSSSRRRGSSGGASTTAKGKKRSFGQYDAANPGGSAATANVPGSVQSLRRALIDGGVGRGNGSVYSVNSPFSTPDSSIPGTPTLDDADFTFGNNGLSAFSALSLRPTSGDDHLPACAPPNLFFPAPGSSSALAGANSTTPGLPGLNPLPNVSGASSSSNLPPPAKRERMSSCGSTAGDTKSVDKDGKVVDKPFRCPNAGCDKAYKQANGLKYHRLHGSCNKNLAGDSQTSSGGNATSTTASPAPLSTPKTAPAPTTPTPATVVRPSPSTMANGAHNMARPNVTPSSLGAGMTPRPPPPNATSNLPSNGVNHLPPLPPNINSAALAAAAALLQRGGPLPPSLQGPNGPIDSAALLKTLQMLQAQVAQQQQGGMSGGMGAPGTKGPTTSGAAPTMPRPLNGNVAQGTRPVAASNGAKPAANPTSVRSPPTAAATTTTAAAAGANAVNAISPEMMAAAQAAAIQKRAQQPSASSPTTTTTTGSPATPKK